MISPGAGEDFTTEQSEVVSLPEEAHALVRAAAGTGKTHTLAGRLTRLVEGEGLSAGDELLVLSFSRAAVAELRRRIAGLAGDAQYVGVATFDSFATRILAAAEPGGPWPGLDYEARIRAAATLLSGQDVPDEVKLVRHILVDEIQDLVGSRSQLVIALLQRAGAGFTLFGDPAQAIYGHQADRNDAYPAEPDLFEWARKNFAKDLVEVELTRDYRAATAQTRVVARVGVSLRGSQPDHSAVSHELRTMLLGLPAVGLTAARRMLTREDGQTSALLTRTNGEALLLSRALFEAGIPHRYQRRGEEKAAPAWLGALTSGLADTYVTWTMLAPRLEQIAAALSTDGDALYGLLRALGPGRGQEIDLRRIADRIREENLPEELNAVAASRVVVSTIHRAKGLEFDRVLLTDPSDRDASDAGEENRVLYVALSRARREIFHVDGPDTTGLSRDPGTSRWVRRGFGSARWKVREFEVTGRDTHALHPAGSWLLSADVRDIQEYLDTEVEPGDPVTLKLLDQRLGEAQVGHYAIWHGTRPVGLTSDEFGQLLGRVLSGRYPVGWPRQIDGLRVELVDTVAGDGLSGRAHGLGSCGLWLRMRVFGLGALRFGNGNSLKGADNAG
jgi:AAA domain/UvrD-like helicase C-terminal domain